MSPTQRSIKLLRDEGWTVAIVEQTIRGPGIIFKRDLFTIGDIIAIRDGETMLVQTTGGLNNLSKRIQKIADCEHLPTIRKANWRIEAHGWRKLKGRWECKRENCS